MPPGPIHSGATTIRFCFSPAPISGDKALEQAVARYAGPKGNLRFPLDEPIPYDLIARIVKHRVKQAPRPAAAQRKPRR